MKSIIAAAALCALSAGAVAHDGMHGPGSEYDANEDGALSLDEYKVYLKDSKQDVARAAELFARADRDKDGELSSAEFVRAQPKQEK